MQDLKITFIQAELFWKNVSANLNAFQDKIYNLSEETDLIILPEMFNTGFVVNPQEIEPAAWKHSLEWMQKIARVKKTVLTGSMIVEDGGHYYNRLYWVNSDGNFVTYNKRHLFSMGGEHLHFTPGKEALIVSLKGWKIKPLICYDLRFPIWAKNNYASNAYDFDILIYVANWPASRSLAWKSLLVARAIENQAYAIGVNRIGLDGNQTPHQGFSGVIEPKGEWISQEVKDVTSIQTISLSAKNLINYRRKFTVGLDWDHFSITQ